MLNRIMLAPKRFMLAALAPRRTFASLAFRQAKRRSITQAPHTQYVMQAIAPSEVDFKHMSFTFAVISLSAQLSTLDGKLSREAYMAFRDAFPLQGGVCNKLRKLFILACQDTTPLDHTLHQIKYIFPRNKILFTTLVERLYGIAMAAGNLSKRKEHMLAKIAHMLEVSPADYARIHERHTAPKPHHILGVEKSISKNRLKQRYHSLMRRYHPDVHASEIVSPELAQLLALRSGEISAAYRALSKRAA